MSPATSTTIRATTATSTRTTTPKPPFRAARAATAGLWLIAAWTLFAFGGAYSWTTVPLVAGAVILTATVRPPILQLGTRALDAALCASVAAAALQLVSLPASLRFTLSPATAAMDRALLLAASADPRSGPPAPLSLDRAAGIESLIIGVSVLLLFWCARVLFEQVSTRWTARALAICGGIAAALALTQHATAPNLLYWMWRPESRAAQFPYTPFVNRNDLAAWLILCLPVSAGYMLARLEVRRREKRLNIDSAFDDTGVWLTVAICLMTAGLVTSLSRSGLTAGVAAAVSIVLLSRGRMERRGRARLLAGLSLLVLVAAAYANVGALMARVGETIEQGVGGRGAIWRTTMAVIRDYWVTGIGVGSFERAMIVYQPPHVLSYNHAHNEYLQIAAEGGLLVGVPMACAAAAAAWTIARRLRRDRTPMFWLRAGATSSLIAIAVQSIWETGLRMPANAVLFALCAAIALHEPREWSVRRERG